MKTVPSFQNATILSSAPQILKGRLGKTRNYFNNISKLSYQEPVRNNCFEIKKERATIEEEFKGGKSRSSLRTIYL